MNHPYARRRRGVVLVWAALLLLIIAAFFALGAETAYVYQVGHQLQNAADAGALAGALQLRWSNSLAISTATSVAQANKAASVNIMLASNPSNDPAGDVVLGTYARPSGPFSATLVSPNAVRVLVRRTAGSPGGALPLIFGKLSNVQSSDVSRTATAMVGGVINAGVVALGPHSSPAIQLTGSGSNPAKIVVNGGGGVVVDSDSSTSVNWSGNPYISAASLYVSGNDTGIASGGVFPSGHLGLNSPPVPDPLGALPAPAKGTAQSGSPPLNPGYYANGLPAGTLAAGIYYVDGGISLKGNEVLDASAGVMIYLHTGGISMKGNSVIKINPPTTGTYAGISFYEDRGNTSAVTLQGTSGMNNSGTLYFPSAAITIAGTPTSFGSQLIASTITVQGNGQLILNYNGNFPVQGHEVFLVK